MNIDYTAFIKLVNAVTIRKPDEVIENSSGVYLNRWYLVRNPPHCNVYVHQFLGSDDDRALHDHPWDSTSIVLAGRYLEHLKEGKVVREIGDVIMRDAYTPHRVELLGTECWTLFTTGPKHKEWGFWCKDGWVHHKDFENNGGCL